MAGRWLAIDPDLRSARSVDRWVQCRARRLFPAYLGLTSRAG